MELFNSAELIISTNGSALTFLLWANPSARVIEIRNKGCLLQNSSHYELMSNVLGLQYNNYSNVVEDEKGNMTIDNDSDIYNYIQNVIGTIGN
jgi:capsular polysaccharide biosynthesis protein